MDKEDPPHRIALRPESELALLIKRAGTSREPLMVDTGAEVYRLDVTPVATAHKRSPRLVRKGLGSKEALMAFAGIWSDLDADRMIEELYEARHQAPPSPTVKP